MTPDESERCAKCGETTIDVLRARDGRHLHWECMTLGERRRENDQCERCGAELDPDLDDSDDYDWIVEDGRVLCGDCVTADEYRAHVREFIAGSRRSQEAARVEDREYPAHLATLAERLERCRRSITLELDLFERWLADTESEAG